MQLSGRESVCPGPAATESGRQTVKPADRAAQLPPQKAQLPPGLELREDEGGLCLSDGKLFLRADLQEMIPRLRPDNLGRELLVKAAGALKKTMNEEGPVRVLDATAGFGEDSLLLAAAGCHVRLCERDPVIAALLRDGLKRAALLPQLSEAVSRMQLREEDSIRVMEELKEGEMDVIYLDPMFPERRKNAQTGKKFQLLHHLEKPCTDEVDLLRAALRARPVRVVVKRPPKGPYLAGLKPDFSLQGKAVRYDILLPRSRKTVEI